MKSRRDTRRGSIYDGTERDWTVRLVVPVQVSAPSRAAAIENAVEVLDEILDGAALIELPPLEVFLDDERLARRRRR